MKAERLLAKLQLQAEREWDKQWRQRQYNAAHPTVTQDMRIERGIGMICHLKDKTDDIRMELEVRKRLKTQEERYLKAAAELREANLTPTERRARKDEVHRSQLQLSRVVCRELSPHWRADATAEFRNKKL